MGIQNLYDPLYQPLPRRRPWWMDVLGDTLSGSLRDIRRMPGEFGRSFMSGMAQVPASLTRTAEGMGEAALRLPGNPLDVVLRPAEALSEAIGGPGREEIRPSLSEAIKETSAAVRKPMEAAAEWWAPEAASWTDRPANALVQGVGGALPQLGAIVGAGLAGGPVAAAGTAAPMVFGASYGEARDRGLDVPEALAKAGVETPISSTLEAVGGGLTGRAIKAMGKRAAPTVMSALGEGGTEELQEELAMALEKATGAEISPEEAVQRRLGSFFTGVGAGGAITGAGRLVRRLGEADTEDTGPSPLMPLTDAEGQVTGWASTREVMSRRDTEVQQRAREELRHARGRTQEENQGLMWLASGGPKVHVYYRGDVDLSGGQPRLDELRAELAAEYQRTYEDISTGRTHLEDGRDYGRDTGVVERERRMKKIVDEIARLREGMAGRQPGAQMNLMPPQSLQGQIDRARARLNDAIEADYYPADAVLQEQAIADARDRLDQLEKKQAVIQKHAPDVVYLTAQPTATEEYIPGRRPEDAPGAMVSRFVVRGNFLDLRSGDPNTARLRELGNEEQELAGRLKSLDPIAYWERKKYLETGRDLRADWMATLRHRAPDIADHPVVTRLRELDRELPRLEWDSGWTANETIDDTMEKLRKAGLSDTDLAEINEALIASGRAHRLPEKAPDQQFAGLLAESLEVGAPAPLEMDTLGTYHMFRDQALPVTMEKLKKLGYDGAQFDEGLQDNIVIFDRKKSVRPVNFGLTETEAQMRRGRLEQGMRFGMQDRFPMKAGGPQPAPTLPEAGRLELDWLPEAMDPTGQVADAAARGPTRLGAFLPRSLRSEEGTVRLNLLRPEPSQRLSQIAQQTEGPSQVSAMRARSPAVNEIVTQVDSREADPGAALAHSTHPDGPANGIINRILGSSGARLSINRLLKSKRGLDPWPELFDAIQRFRDAVKAHLVPIISAGKQIQRALETTPKERRAEASVLMYEVLTLPTPASPPPLEIQERPLPLEHAAASSLRRQAPPEIVGGYPPQPIVGQRLVPTPGRGLMLEQPPEAGSLAPKLPTQFGSAGDPEQARLQEHPFFSRLGDPLAGTRPERQEAQLRDWYAEDVTEPTEIGRLHEPAPPQVSAEALFPTDLGGVPAGYPFQGEAPTPPVLQVDERRPAGLGEPRPHLPYGPQVDIRPEAVRLAEQRQALLRRIRELTGKDLEPHLNAMRATQDRISRKIVEGGYVSDDMAAVFGDNLGQYVRRQFLLHQDPEHAARTKTERQDVVERAARALMEDAVNDTLAKHPTWTRQRALQHIFRDPAVEREDLAGMTEAELAAGVQQQKHKAINLYIQKFLRPQGPGAFPATAMLSLTPPKEILTHRKDLLPELMEVFEEHKDPVMAMMHSVEMSARYLEIQKAFERIAEIGRRGGLFVEPDALGLLPVLGIVEGTQRARGTALEGVALSDPNPAGELLSALVHELNWTPTWNISWMRPLQSLASRVKLGKVGYGTQPQARNYQGGVGYTIINGSASSRLAYGGEPIKGTGVKIILEGRKRSTRAKEMATAALFLGEARGWLRKMGGRAGRAQAPEGQKPRRREEAFLTRDTPEFRREAHQFALQNGIDVEEAVYVLSEQGAGLPERAREIARERGINEVEALRQLQHSTEAGILDRVVKATELGVVVPSIGVGEVERFRPSDLALEQGVSGLPEKKGKGFDAWVARRRRAIREATKDIPVVGRAVEATLLNPMRRARQIFTWTDVQFRLFTWENEINVELYKMGRSDLDALSLAEERAAETTKNIYQNYDRLNAVIRGLRDVFLVASFPGFQAEVVRNSIHIMKKGASEIREGKALRVRGLQTGDQELVERGTRYMAVGGERLLRYGVGTLVGLPAYTKALGALTFALAGLGGELFDEDVPEAEIEGGGLLTELYTDLPAGEEEKLRVFLPEFMRGMVAVRLDKEKGKIWAMDRSYASPTAVYDTLIRALLESDPDLVETAIRGMTEFLAPSFIQTDITTEAGLSLREGVIDLWRTGDWNAMVGPGYDAFKKVAPSAVLSLERFRRAGGLKWIGAGDKVTEDRYGRAYNRVMELMAMAGPRIMELDPERSLQFAAGRFKWGTGGRSAAARRTLDVKGDPLIDIPGIVTTAEARVAHSKWEISGQELLEMVQAAQALRLMTDHRIDEILKTAKITEDNRKRLLLGDLPLLSESAPVIH